MKLAWAFLRRDATIALSYRIAFIMQFAGNLVLVGLLYFIGKTVGPQGIPQLQQYGGSFLAYALIGVALTDCVVVSLVSFATQIREAQTTGTLEATLMSPVSLSRILIYSSLWNYVLSAIRFLFYLAVGALLFGVDLKQANAAPAVIIFFLTVLSFMGIGMMWAAVVLLVKRGESIMTVIGYMVLLLTGIFFPVTLLPGWLQNFSLIIPLTHGLNGMRAALLSGAGMSDLTPTLTVLTAFAAALMLAGVIGFNMAVGVAKRTGSLTQY